MDAIYFESPGVARLQVLLDEVTRAKPGAPETGFVQPEGGLTDRLKSRFHHVLYGRRGTGKSSLLGGGWNSSQFHHRLAEEPAHLGIWSAQPA